MTYIKMVLLLPIAFVALVCLSITAGCVWLANKIMEF